MNVNIVEKTLKKTQDSVKHQNPAQKSGIGYLVNIRERYGNATRTI